MSPRSVNTHQVAGTVVRLLEDELTIPLIAVVGLGVVILVVLSQT
jgi:hypothetical protein